ncbi:MAG TPA: PilZ domain-containing protein [Syntrophobacteria bacterium]|nr:PilZ domain-containing protein [Syntrophobacteria bacterium]
MSRRLEHRKHPRVTIEWPAVLMTRDGQREGTIRNISLGGALIACVEMPALDDRFILVAESDGGVVLKLTAEKVWSANFNLDGKTVFSGVGVRFTEVSEDDHQIIKSAVSQHVSRSKPLRHKALKPAVVGL